MADILSGTRSKEAKVAPQTTLKMHLKLEVDRLIYSMRAENVTTPFVRHLDSPLSRPIFQQRCLGGLTRSLSP